MTHSSLTHSTLAESIVRLQKGLFVAVSDNSDREDEADLVIAAEFITEEQMAFLIRHTSGIITVPMTKEQLDRLQLPLLTNNNTANFGTPFAIPVDLKNGTRGGVSARERVLTVRALVDPNTKPEDLGRPGHIFPLQGHSGGLQARQGHTEAALALLSLANLQPIGVIGELMNDDGTMMRGDSLHTFLEKHDIPHISIESISQEVV